MTPEREKLIRETWAEVRDTAMRAFCHRSRWSVYPLVPLEPLTTEAPAVGPGIHPLNFDHEVARSPATGLRTGRWRVVCEGLILEAGVGNGPA